MTTSRFLLPVFLLGILFTACSKDDGPIEEKEELRNVEVEQYIYRGMSDIYLYKADIPQLRNNYFSSNADARDFFRTFDSPKEFFDGIVSSQDRFSFLVEDYVELEKSFKGVSTSTGVDYVLYQYTDEGDILGMVRYIVPNTNAEGSGIERGDAFTMINGEPLTTSNYSSLLSSPEVTFHLSTLKDNVIVPTDETVSIVSHEFAEDPVLISKTFEDGAKKIGYLMYNSFTSDFDYSLNNAFGEFKAAGVNELILDLRYNGGGSVESAVDLASMITGQYEGEVFLRQQWNNTYQNAWAPESYVDRFNNEIGEDETAEEINSLGLEKVYVLTTDRTASASELIINGLSAYINVVQIGTTTTGKFQASVTLYDSPAMTNKTSINTNHNYAIQPLIYKSANAKGVSDYVDGLIPDIEEEENLNEMGVLGDENEPLLRLALNEILGLPQEQEVASKSRTAFPELKVVGERGMDAPGYQRMYTKNLPMPLGNK